MNLADTVQALEAKEIVVALDIGVHTSCDLESNCPLAVQLRRLVADAGVTLEQLSEAYIEGNMAADPVDYEPPEFDSTLHLSIGGKDIELDFTDVIQEQLRVGVEQKMAAVEVFKEGAKKTGSALYYAYLQEIKKQRDSQTLPQKDFTVRSLIEAGCLITSSGKEYVFLFPSEYNPQYIVRNGIRYKMSDEDIILLKTRIWFKLTVTQAGKFLRADVLDSGGNKFQHYHGDRTYDCWGDVALPRSWDGRLEPLSRLVHVLEASLVTINHDSLLQREPARMPHIDSLLSRSTELGREGETGEVPEARPAGRTRWGERRQEQPRVLTEADEYRRRWGVPTFDEAGGLRDERAICAVCGNNFSEHTNYICPGNEELTLDEEMMGRWGRTDIGRENPNYLDEICAFCGEYLRDHSGERIEVCPRDRRG